MPNPLFHHLLNLKKVGVQAAFISTGTVQTVPTTTLTTLVFASPTVAEPLGASAFKTLWDPGTPSQFTVHTAGFYLMGASLVWASAATSQIMLAKNGAVIAVQQANSAGLAVTTMMPAAVGDVFTVQVIQYSGAPLATSPSPNMWVIQML